MVLCSSGGCWQCLCLVDPLDGFGCCCTVAGEADFGPSL